MPHLQIHLQVIIVVVIQRAVGRCLSILLQLVDLVLRNVELRFLGGIFVLILSWFEKFRFG
jgi:hypothetical protein